MNSILLIALTIYLEAANQSLEGKLAVAQVIAERLHDDRWPGSTPDEIILQRKQFSCWNNRKPEDVEIRVNDPIFLECFEIAIMLDAGDIKGLGYNHYYNPNICKPSWFNRVTEYVDIGDHRFCVI